MVKGVAVKLKSYEETLPKLLKLIKFDQELKKHDKIVLKPNLIEGDETIATRTSFIEPIIKFLMENKNPGTEIFIAEGCDGHDTLEVFEKLGYTFLAEKYGLGLIDLNNSETEEIESPNFLKFESIKYPKILLDSFVISLPYVSLSNTTQIAASIDSMIGAFPAKHYSGFFSSSKNKLNKYTPRHQVHDITFCKLPDFAIMDASEKNIIMAGQPLEMDKQAAKLFGLNWHEVEHLKIIEESLKNPKDMEKEVDALIENA